MSLPFNTEITMPKLNPDGSLAEDTNQAAPYIALNVAHVNNQKALVAIGQNVFEELVRQDIEGTMETREMVAHSGDLSSDPANYKVFDLTRDLDVGMPISIDIYENDLNQISRLGSDVAAKTQYLISRGYPNAIASQFAQTLQRTTPVFYVKSIQYMLDEDSAWTMKISFINFLDINSKFLGKT